MCASRGALCCRYRAWVLATRRPAMQLRARALLNPAPQRCSSSTSISTPINPRICNWPYVTRQSPRNPSVIVGEATATGLSQGFDHLVRHCHVPVTSHAAHGTAQGRMAHTHMSRQPQIRKSGSATLRPSPCLSRSISHPGFVNQTTMACRCTLPSTRCSPAPRCW